jgi:hypothetical protein
VEQENAKKGKKGKSNPGTAAPAGQPEFVGPRGQQTPKK